jgi:hypothetical protein
MIEIIGFIGFGLLAVAAVFVLIVGGFATYVRWRGILSGEWSPLDELGIR